MALERELAVAVRLALQAGDVLRRYRAAPLEIGSKARGEIVTPADREVDALIRAGLATPFAADALFSEETADSPARLTHDRVWIVDPLDGTSNYAAGGDEHAVSIGLAIAGEATLGVVYNPARDELVAGYRGRGVTLNGTPARVGDAAEPSAARLTVSSKEWRGGLAAMAGPLAIRPVASMAYKLARVAAGLDDGVFSTIPRKEWGTCAGVALVLAAGGRVTTLDGGEPRFNQREPRPLAGLLAAGPALYPALRQALAGMPVSAGEAPAP